MTDANAGTQSQLSDGGDRGGLGAAVAAVAAVGGLATDTDSSWYRSLDLPSFQPPGSAFGIVWTILYVLIAIAATLAARDVPGFRRRLVVGMFTANLVLNVAWTWILFQASRRSAPGSRSFFCSDPRSG